MKEAQPEVPIPDRPMSSIPVYVIHRGAPALVVSTVAALLASEGVSLSLTVVDNGSDVDTLSRLGRDLPAGVSVSHLPRNMGFAGAANMAIEDARHVEVAPRYVCLAAHDVIVEADALRKLVAALEADEHLGIVAPRLRQANGAIGVGTPYPPDRHAGSAVTSAPGVKLVDTLSGAVLVIRLSCALDLGGFDERLFAYCEDTDICLRAWRRGWKVGIVTGGMATDRGSTTPLVDRIYLICRNHLLLLRWHLSARAFLGASVVVASRIVRACVGGFWPTRDRERRRRSRAFALGQALGLRDAVLDRSGPPGKWRA